MRRQRRGSSSGHEFGGSGEDSFVAVVVTKLTGALLFILLLTMVIMALIPKSVDQAASSDAEAAKQAPIKIATPSDLPEAIAGRPYHLALATTGGTGPLRWMLEGELPTGLAFDSETGTVEGTPTQGTPSPIALNFWVSDTTSSDKQVLNLLVYESDKPLTTPSSWKPGIPPIPWREWLNQGVGFLLIWLVHLVGMNALTSLRYRAKDEALDDEESRLIGRRFVAYKVFLYGVTLTAAAGLAAWLWWPR